MRLRGGDDRRGIALVVVLGLLALVTMVAVAFSVFMRTERLVAGNYQNEVRARQLLHVAFVRAMADIEQRMTNGAGRVYPALTPEENVIASGGGGERVSDVATNSDLCAYVPRAFWGRIQAILDADGLRWVASPDGGGRYAYMIVNCSGLVDANYAGGLVGASLAPRRAGTSSSELQLRMLPDVGSAAAALTFVSGRDGPSGNRRYETVAELKDLTSGSGTVPAGPANFSVYSRAPTTNLVSLGGGVAGLLSRQAEIKSALQQCVSGADASDANAMFDALIDYADADSIPRNASGPTTERVPMPNELMLQGVVTFEGASAQSRVVLFTEWFYPFVTATAKRFVLKYDITLTAVGGTPAALMPGGSSPQRFTGQVDAEYSGQTHNNGHHVVVLAEQMVSAPFAWSNFIGRPFSVQVDVDSLSVADAASPGQPLATAARQSFVTPAVTIPAIVSGEALVSQGVGAEAVDPRFAFDAADWVSYDDVAGIGLPVPVADPELTPGPNPITDFHMQQVPTDEHTFMHVADKDIESVGELSFLVRGNKAELWWSTIRLTNEIFAGLSDGTTARGCDPIYDRFTMDTNTVLKGRINPNTDNEDVLETAFVDMKIDMYPGDPAPVRTLTDVEAANVVRNGWCADPNWGTYSSFAMMCSNQAYLGHPYFAGLNPFQQESALRNLLGLVHYRQNVFIILLWAQATRTVQRPITVGTDWRNPGTMESVRSDQSAVAEVWRDPIGVSSGGRTNHPSFRRLFRIVAD